MVDSEYPTLVDRQTGNTIVINTNPFSLGRRLGCSYVISNKVVSRTHCVLEKHGDAWFLQDTSSNGTYLNDKLIKSTKSPPLSENSVIRLDQGGHSYVFHLPKANGVSMDDVSDEQHCVFADSVLNEGENVNVPDTASNHPLHDNAEMVRLQENHHIDKKPRVEEPATSLKVVDVADTSTKSENSLSLQPGQSSDVVSVTNLQGIPQSSKEPIQGNYEVIENELQCIICSELFVKAVTLNCTHSFCKYCVELWKQTKSECPICRTKISSKTATLVLDNIVEKVLKGSSDETREHRKEVLQERRELEETKTDEDDELDINRRRSARLNPQNNVRPDVDAIVHPVIQLSSGSEGSDWDYSETGSSSTSDSVPEEFTDEEWFNEGVADAHNGDEATNEGVPDAHNGDEATA